MVGFSAIISCDRGSGDALPAKIVGKGWNMTDPKVSRRAFMGTSAAIGAAAGFGSLAAYGAEATVQEGDVWDIGELDEPTETMDVDLCIVGAGGCGVAAALQAKQIGVENLLVIEKQDVTGGSFIGTEGMFAVGSHWQKEAGETATSAEIIQECMTYHHWQPEYDLYRTFFDKTADTIDWLEENGVEFDHVQALGNSHTCWHIYKGSNHPGVEFMASLTKAATDAGVTFETGLSGKKLLLGDNGEVKGLLAQRKDGTVVEIDAPAVIVATGGYANNTELTSTLTGKPADFFNPAGTEGRDGDGIKMARDAGAALTRFPGTLQVTGPVCRGSKWGDDIAAICLQPTLWINQKGERYIGENMSIKNFTFAGTAMLNQDRVFVIESQAQIDRFTSGDGLYVNVGVYALAGQTLPDLPDEIEELVEKGTVYVADTVAELAEKIGVDPAALGATVEKYNGYCDTGVDEDFFKDAEMLCAIPESDGPYYAFDCQDNYPTTCGGIRITPTTEALDGSGNVIAGLYVGGVDAGGFYGDAYDVGIAAGSTAAWAINSGRMAAEQVARYLA